MRIPKSFVLLILTGLLLFLCSFSASAEERFGPWVYFAPYYFPPDGTCKGHCLSPNDFLPTYESPNPPAPNGECPPRTHREGPAPVKVAAQRFQAAPANVNRSPTRPPAGIVKPFEKPSRVKATEGDESLQSILRQKSRPLESSSVPRRGPEPQPVNPAVPGQPPRSL